jgi:hypothetical protein
MKPKPLVEVNISYTTSCVELNLFHWMRINDPDRVKTALLGREEAGREAPGVALSGSLTSSQPLLRFKEEVLRGFGTFP